MATFHDKHCFNTKNTQKQRNNNNRNTRNRKILPRPGNLTRDLFFHSLMRYHLTTDKRID